MEREEVEDLEREEVEDIGKEEMQIITVGRLKSTSRLKYYVLNERLVQDKNLLVQNNNNNNILNRK